MGFSLKRDFKHVQWGATLQVMFVRAVGAALITSILNTFIVTMGDLDLEEAGTSYPVMALYVFGAIVFAGTFIYPWMGLICWWMLSFFVKVEGKTRRFMTPDNGVFFLPLIIIGLFGFLGYLGITLLLMLGDPFAFVLRKVKPGLVPIDRYSFLNFVPIVFAVHPDHMENLRMSGNAA